jgi:aspartate aminotransferase
MSATATSNKLFADRTTRIELSATLAISAEASRMKAQGIDVVDFGAGEPAFSTPQHIKDAAIAAIQNNFTKYTAVSGIPELREAIVKRHAADFGSEYKPSEAVATTGGKHALFNAFQVLVDHGDEVIIPTPYWTSFKDIVQYAGGECVYVDTHETNDFKLTAEMIARALTPRTKVILLNTPCNPSGAVMDPDDVREVVKLACERGIYVISDECYVYLNYTGRNFSLGSLTSAKQSLVIVGSLSKTYAMTGWRSGYALAPEAIAGNIQKVISQQTSSPVHFVQKAAAAALNGPQDCIARMKAEYMQLRDVAVDGMNSIPGVTCVRPDGAFYVYPNVSSFFGRGGINSAADISKRLLQEAKVVAVPGEAFGTREHIRLSYAVTMDDLRKGVARMKEFFAAL